MVLGFVKTGDAAARPPRAVRSLLPQKLIDELETASMAGSLGISERSDGSEWVSVTLQKDADQPLIQLNNSNWDKEETRYTYYEVIEEACSGQQRQ